MERDGIARIFNTSYIIAKTDFKIKNEGSYLGFLWNILTPLLVFLILLSIRGVVNIGNDPNYPVYLLIGLMVFNFFRQSSISSLRAITGNSKLINSMNISPMVFIMAKMIYSIFSHLFELLILICVLIIYGISVNWLFIYLIIFVFLVVFTFGLNLILSTLFVFIRDINDLWNVFVRILWFATPIFYGLDNEGVIYKFNLFNPLFYFIEISRSVIINNKIPEFTFIFVGIFFSFLFLFVGLLLYQKNKSIFAERI
jgi:ABC-type polysaccharide/polyol phosphate export permease